MMPHNYGSSVNMGLSQGVSPCMWNITYLTDSSLSIHYTDCCPNMETCHVSVTRVVAITRGK